MSDWYNVRLNEKTGKEEKYLTDYPDRSHMMVGCVRYAERVRRAWLKLDMMSDRQFRMFSLLCDIAEILTASYLKENPGKNRGRSGVQVKREAISHMLKNYKNNHSNVSHMLNDLEKIGAIEYIRGRRRSKCCTNGIPPVMMLKPPPGVHLRHIQDDQHPSHRIEFNISHEDIEAELDADPVSHTPPPQ